MRCGVFGILRLGVVVVHHVFESMGFSFSFSSYLTGNSNYCWLSASRDDILQVSMLRKCLTASLSVLRRPSCHFFCFFVFNEPTMPTLPLPHSSPLHSPYTLLRPVYSHIFFFLPPAAGTCCGPPAAVAACGVFCCCGPPPCPGCCGCCTGAGALKFFPF